MAGLALLHDQLQGGVPARRARRRCEGGNNRTVVPRTPAPTGLARSAGVCVSPGQCGCVAAGQQQVHGSCCPSGACAGCTVRPPTHPPLPHAPCTGAAMPRAPCARLDSLPIRAPRGVCKVRSRLAAAASQPPPSHVLACCLLGKQPSLVAHTTACRAVFLQASRPTALQLQADHVSSAQVRWDEPPPSPGPPQPPAQRRARPGGRARQSCALPCSRACTRLLRQRRRLHAVAEAAAALVRAAWLRGRSIIPPSDSAGTCLPAGRCIRGDACSFSHNL